MMVLREWKEAQVSIPSDAISTNHHGSLGPDQAAGSDMVALKPEP